MAVRSGAGTGVLISLVVFVLITIFLLVLTIVFHGGKTAAEEEARETEQILETYVSRAQRNNDRFKAFEAAAGQERKSVAQYLSDQKETLAELVVGNPSASMDDIVAQADRFELGDDSVIDGMEGLRRQLRMAETETQTTRDLLAEREQRNAELQARLEDLKDEHEEQLAELRQDLGGYVDAAQQYQQDVLDTIARLEDAKEDLREQYRGRIDQLQETNDATNQELVVLRRRVNELQQQIRVNNEVVDPAMLVDAEVIDVVAGDEVYINRGANDRIVLGQTFEVYDSAQAIRVNRRTDELPRGKASVQVTQVSDQTA
jgi:DNA repair exonuclease SbcCD ATPase subunit